MALTLASAADLLKEHHLLREIIQGDVWTDDPARIASADEPFAGITYDTRKVTPGTLLCCKGRFKAEYLNGIDEAGLAAYVAETEYSAATATPGLIVNDARKAMSLLSAAFYGYPQNAHGHRRHRHQGQDDHLVLHAGAYQRRLRRQGRIVLLGR